MTTGSLVERRLGITEGAANLTFKTQQNYVARLPRFESWPNQLPAMLASYLR